MRARATLAVAIVALAAACAPAGSSPEENSAGTDHAAPPRSATSDHDARREDLRARLRVELGENYDVPLPEATGAQLEGGAELWEVLCTGCHGTTGRGTRSLSRMLPVAPGDLTDPERAAFFSERAKVRIVAEGSEGTPMFGWQDVLREQDMRATIAHLQTLVAARRERP